MRLLPIGAGALFLLSCIAQRLETKSSSTPQHDSQVLGFFNHFSGILSNPPPILDNPIVAPIQQRPSAIAGDIARANAAARLSALTETQAAAAATLSANANNAGLAQVSVSGIVTFYIPLFYP